MPQVLWDASALIKRYLLELGSDVVDALWSASAVTGSVTTFLGYVETAAILRRRLNEGQLDTATYSGMRLLLQQEILNVHSFHLLPIDATMAGAVALLDRHNINASDAAILSAFTQFASSSPETSVVVTADRRLLRAAGLEGLATLNPETMPAADVATFMASLS